MTVALGLVVGNKRRRPIKTSVEDLFRFIGSKKIIVHYMPTIVADVVSIDLRRSTELAFFMVHINVVVFFILRLIYNCIELVHQVLVLVIRILGEAERKDILDALQLRRKLLDAFLGFLHVFPIIFDLFIEKLLIFDDFGCFIKTEQLLMVELMEVFVPDEAVGFKNVLVEKEGVLDFAQN